MIILLNGTSSAGKTTLARILQARYDGVLLLYGVDVMVQAAFPEKCDMPPWDEKAIRVEMTEVAEQPCARLVVSPYMYPVYRSAVEFYRSLSALGYDLIVDEVLFDANRVGAYFELLADEVVYFIGVKPDKATVAAREKARGDRLPGLAVGLYDIVYDPLFEYDLTLDTGSMAPETAAGMVLDCLARTPAPQAFGKTAQRWLAYRGGKPV